MSANIKFFSVILASFLIESYLSVAVPQMGRHTPSISLLLALFLGISHGSQTAFQLGFFLGLCHETLSLSPFGTSLLVFGVAMWICGHLKEWVFLDSFTAQFAVPFTVILIIRLFMYIAFRTHVEWELDMGSWWNIALDPPILSTTLMGPLIYALLKHRKWIA